MEIRSELVKSAVLEYVEEVFSGLEFNAMNLGSLVVAKIFVDRNFNKLASLLENEEGTIPIDLVEKYGEEAMKKLKVIEIPKIGSKLLFKEDDFHRLISKIKSKGEM